MNDPIAPRDWRLLRVALVSGYVHGCRYPSLVLSLQGTQLRRQECQRLTECLVASAPSMSFPTVPVFESCDFMRGTDWLLSLWQALQVALGIPVYERGRILRASKDRVLCLLPGLESVFGELTKIISGTLDFISHISSVEEADARKNLVAAVKKLHAKAPSASNVPRFVQAAFELGMPFLEMPGGAFQYGVARHARWLDSSFTDATPNISARLSRDKFATSALLKQAGLPTPPHYLVTEIDHALRFAQRLGYPVVIKPANLDGGVGVSAGLETEVQLQEAFAHAKKCSSQILVEKHFHGKDYRITVFNSEAIWAIERVPAGVTGDGRSTIAELVDCANADPRRGSGRHAPLKRLVVDDDAKSLLHQQQLSLTTIPAEGAFIRLRRAANVASGGMPVAVFDRVHPDNARLAVRAADILRLDLAGIDLLIPDISVSWRESGAAICEVNGQPNLGQTTAAHLYAPILRNLVSGSGRVPTVLIFGARQPRDWLEAFAVCISKLAPRVGIVDADGVRIAGEWVHQGATSPYEGGKMLVLDRRVDAVIVAINDDRAARQGLAFDRYDAIVLAGENLRPRDNNPNRKAHIRSEDVLHSLLPACDGVIISREAVNDIPPDLIAQCRAIWKQTEGTIAEVAEHAVEWIEKCIAEREDKLRPNPVCFS